GLYRGGQAAVGILDAPQRALRAPARELVQEFGRVHHRQHGALAGDDLVVAPDDPAAQLDPAGNGAAGVIDGVERLDRGVEPVLAQRDPVRVAAEGMAYPDQAAVAVTEPLVLAQEVPGFHCCVSKNSSITTGPSAGWRRRLGRR